MKCVNGCVIKESELDDAVEVEGGKLLCGRCISRLWPEVKMVDDSHDQRGRFTGRKGRKCYNPSFGTIGTTR